MRYVVLAVLVLCLAAGCDDNDGISPTSTKSAVPVPSPSPTLAQRIQQAETATAARAHEPRFKGEILGVYLASSQDGWPDEIKAEADRRFTAPCVASPAGQGELDFMMPLTPPDGWIPSGEFAATTKPEVTACGGHTTGATWVFQRDYADSPATVTLARSVSRAEAFDAPASDVTARTIGFRQAVLVAAPVAGAPAQRSLVIFPEDFGMTVLHAFNVPEAELITFAETVARASAPYWERAPAGMNADYFVRTCSEIPDGINLHQAAFGTTDDGRTARHTYFYSGAGETYALVLFPGDALDDCDQNIAEGLSFGADAGAFEAVEEWLDTQDGEFFGECRTRPGPVGVDPDRYDWCYYRPNRLTSGIITFSLSRPSGFDYLLEVALEADAGGRYEVRDVYPPILPNFQVSFFHDENAIRWSGIERAASYRLRGDLVAVREHASDPCAAPPLADEIIDIALDDVVAAEADAYPLSLPDLPPVDAWYVSVDGMLTIDALDAAGEVIDSTGTSWVRDTFCVRPIADATP